MNILDEARSVFNKEITAIEATRDALGADFEKMVELILNCRGKLVLTGMGKPGHIATKIAATFASLGTPSFFMHPGEAMHGDLGMVQKKDVIILMSYSGESEEVTRLMPVLQEIGCTTIAITMGIAILMRSLPRGIVPILFCAWSIIHSAERILS